MLVQGAGGWRQGRSSQIWKVRVPPSLGVQRGLRGWEGPQEGQALLLLHVEKLRHRQARQPTTPKGPVPMLLSTAAG